MATTLEIAMSDVVDLLPLIRTRQAETCEHLHVEVSPTVAELTCTGCQCEIDPWWYLRSLAHREAEIVERRRKWKDQWKNLIQVQATRLLEQAADEIRRLKDALHEERTANRRRQTTEMQRMKADLADLRQAGRQR